MIPILCILAMMVPPKSGLLINAIMCYLLAVPVLTLKTDSSMLYENQDYNFLFRFSLCHHKSIASHLLTVLQIQSHTSQQWIVTKITIPSPT